MMMSSAWSQGMSFRRSVRLPDDRVAGDDVEAGEVGDHLQHRAHFDVLEVERQLLALVALARALRQLVRILDDRLHLEDEAVVRLVGRVLPQALRLDDHPHVAALRERVDGDDRRAEVLDVEPALEVARQRRLDEVDDQRPCPAGGCRCRSRCRTGRRRCGPRRRRRGGSRRRAACAATSPGRASAKFCTTCCFASSCSLWSNSVTSTVLPSTCVSNVCGRLRLNTTRVRLPAWTTLTLRSATSSIVALRRAEPVGGVEKVERDARRASRSRSRPADSPAAFFSVNLTIVRPDAPFDTVSESMLLRSARRPRRTRRTPAQRRATRTRHGSVAPGSRWCQAKRTRSFSSLLCLGVGLDQLQRARALGPVAARRPAPVPSGGSRRR